MAVTFTILATGCALVAFYSLNGSEDDNWPDAMSTLLGAVGTALLFAVLV